MSILTHHAELIEGNLQKFKSILSHLETTLGFPKTHPDLMTFSYVAEKLGVDEAHLIHDALLRKPVKGDKVIVVVYATTITEQAQNALLKISEEPPQGSHIILVTDFLPHLIPTLRSRFSVLHTAFDLDSAGSENDISNGISTNAGSKEKNKLLNAENFLISGIDSRLATVKDIHTALDKETISISEVWNFINEMEAVVAGDQGDQKTASKTAVNKQSISERAQTLEICATVSKYMHAPGNSIKMLLEYLAVRL